MTKTLVGIALGASLVLGWQQTTRSSVPAAQMQRPPLEMTVESKLGFQETVEAVKAASEAQKYAVQYVHKVSETFASKGFPREPVTIVEICNAKAASQVMKNDIRAGLHMPCPVMVYQQGDKVFVSTFDTRVLSSMYSGSEMPALGNEVYVVLANVLKAVEK
jgi:uncharacterized protein (DUF302 family)